MYYLLFAAGGGDNVNPNENVKSDVDNHESKVNAARQPENRLCFVFFDLLMCSFHLSVLHARAGGLL